MSLIEVLFVAVGLAMDAFAVSLGIGTAGRANRPRPIFRLSFHFGLFQGLMPVLGWAAGSTVAHLISGIDHWVALVLLAYVGVRMILSGLNPDSDCCCNDPSRGGTMVMLCVATSIDAFAVGLSLAMLRVQILYPSVVIALVTGVLCFGGLILGRHLGRAFGKRMEIVGGLVLNAIGLRVLLTHLF